jgi:citrate lyase beta subunit
MHLRRSLLFAPGDDLRKITKASQCNADGVILELEDGVALNRKAEARKTIVDAIRILDFGKRERLIRVNGTTTSFFEDDLRETIEARPDTYILPKVEQASEVRRINDLIEHAERERGWSVGGIGLIVLVESPLGILNLREICEATSRLQAIIFGAEDYASFVGAKRTRSSIEVLYARSAVVNACAAFGLQALDMVHIDFNDLNALEEECLFGRQLGYTGKQVIHPKQIDTVNRCFSPTESEIAFARNLIQAFEKHQIEGAGAFAYEGKMIDMPIVRQAQNILASADSRESSVGSRQ